MEKEAKKLASPKEEYHPHNEARELNMVQV